MLGDKPAVRENDRIDTSHDYALCAWARHFNVSEKALRAAVAAVGDRALQVQRHLDGHGPSRRANAGERPGSR